MSQATAAGCQSTGTADDRRWMRRAIDLAYRCPRSTTAYAVGAVIVGQDGTETAHGYSRENDPHVHAEESALAKVPDDPRLSTATLYSTLEPCSHRRSRPDAPCAQLIIRAGIRRVVIAWREPALFATCEGVTLLTGAGVEIVELPDLAEMAQRPNSHLNLWAGP
ncbi:deaminase [Actinoplanes sp. NPDC049596]|uniref:deaminase n=1 Tax=unclassified Actinoplanes TaxID=2626549 RepID=UPI00344166F1